MNTKTWARLSGTTVAELLPIDASLVPGRDIPALWTDDVTTVAGIAIGWVKASDGSFAAPPVDLVLSKMRQLAILNEACSTAILNGFTSSALGSLHSYPSALTDQQNMIASVTASLLPNLPADWSTPFWCADTTGTWAFTAHTAAQIQQAGTDGKAMVLAAQAKLEGYRQMVAAAANADAVVAIAWS